MLMRSTWVTQTQGPVASSTSIERVDPTADAVDSSLSVPNGIG